MKITAFLLVLIIMISPAAFCAPPRADSQNAPEKFLYLVATAHLDTQWRWTIQQTIDEFLPLTFEVNARNFEMFPDYEFSFEGAFRYMLLREYYPDYYQRLKRYIGDGRWHVAGSWVDAVDVNVPSPESLVRHALYGNGFFKKEFGKTSRDVYLPDCFGFGYALPSIAAHCGITAFSTQKLTWGSWIGVPFGIGIWEGVDGSTLLAALNPGEYVAKVRSDLSRDSLLVDMVDKQGKESGLYAAFRYFGVGDTGGGPDSASVAWVEKSIAGGGPLTVRNIGSDELTEIITPEQQKNLPRYKGELLMTRHGVGCYTSQAAMKRWNRKNEFLADAAERASVIAHLLGGAQYPREFLRNIWTRFLWHQFHDDLTGTSIPEAYEFSWNDEVLCLNQFSAVLENAVASTTPAMDTRVKGVPLVVFNPLSIAREDVVEATVMFEDGVPAAARVYDPEGNEVPSQCAPAADGGGMHVVFLAGVPSVGYAVYDVRPAKKPCEMKTGLEVTTARLENERYVVLIHKMGEVASIFDKFLDRKLLSGPIQMQLFHDKPLRWAAWEIDYEAVCAQPRATVGGQPRVNILENGPARVSLEIINEQDNSTFRRVISLAAGGAGDRVEIANVVDWNERETLLKAEFPLAPAGETVTYDLGVGTIERGVNKPELYEVPAQQWADVSSPAENYGVAVMNDCKYGWDYPEAGTLRLSLIHTPGVYDNWAWIGDQSSQDVGRHEFTYAVHGHAGDWREGAVQWEAARLNQPLLAFQTTKHKGKLGKSYSVLDVAVPADVPQVAVRAFKMAENGDEVIVRLQELHGKPAKNVRVRFNRPVTSAREVNGAEEPLGDAAVNTSNGELEVSLKPYQPRAFAVTLAPYEKVKLAQPTSLPLELPFDTDGVSLDAGRTDGDFDGAGNTISGDLLPGRLFRHGINYVFGPSAPGAKNAVTCRGQTLSLPKGDYDKLYLLVSAVGGAALGEFSVDGHGTKVWVQDYAAPVGQWNNRLLTGVFDDRPGKIAPVYINRAPVAWAGTHRHTAAGKNEAYRFTYLYLVELGLPQGAATLTLADNDRIKLLAATAAQTPADDILDAQPLYDVADNTFAKIHADRFSFLHETAFTASTPIPGAVIHYTTDGSDPTADSPRYTGPVTLTETATVKARAFREGSDNSHVTAIDFKSLVALDPAEAGEVKAGLHCSYYEGEWSKLPDFAALRAAKEFVANSIAIPEAARDEDYGLVFTGYVKIPREGMYDFSITSDDGSALYVADSLLADNDGLHGSYEVTGAIALKAGLFPIKAVMFQRTGGEALEVTVGGPGIEKQPLPAGMLFHAKAGKKR